MTARLATLATESPEMNPKTKTHGALISLVIGVALAFATPALGAQDPVEEGSMKLKLSSASPMRWRARE